MKELEEKHRQGYARAPVAKVRDVSNAIRFALDLRD